jgi:mutator protein MutT
MYDFDMVTKFDFLLSQAKKDKIARFCVAAVILNKEGKVLVCQRNKQKKVAPGAWHMPGGGVDEGENIGEAIARELKEELSLEVVSVDSFSGVLHDYPADGGMHRTAFIILEAKGKIILNEENEAYQFISFEELEKYLEPSVISYNKKVMQYARHKKIISDIL